MIVPTSTSIELSRKISEILEEDLVLPKRKVFPDGELYIRIPQEDDNIIIIGSTHQPDRNWIELLLLADAAKRITEDVKVIIPYYGYGRQDKVFLPGEPISAEVFARALPINTFATVEPHFIREYGVFKVYGKEVHSLSASRVIGEYLRSYGVDALVAPDEGAKNFVELINRVTKVEVHVFHKERDRETGRLRMTGEIVEGDVVAIVDDIIGSGGTMLLASERIQAKEILFVGVHGVFSQGWERLKERGKVIVTDTIQRSESRISVAEVIARWLK